MYIGITILIIQGKIQEHFLLDSKSELINTNDTTLYLVSFNFIEAY